MSPGLGPLIEGAEPAWVGKLLETGPALVLVVDDMGRVIHCNGAVERLCGCSLSAVRGRPWLEALGWLDNPREPVEGGAAVLVGTNRHAIRAHDGSRRMIEWRGQVGPGHVIAIGVELEPRHVLDAMEVYVGVLDTEGYILDANRSANRTGYLATGGPIIGVRVDELVARAYSEATVEAVRAALARARAGERGRFELRTVDGARVTEVTLGPLRGEDGEVHEFVVAGIDISESRRNEQRLRSSLAAKDQLVQEIHHRVRNNLQFVTSLLYLSGHGQAEAVRAVLDGCSARMRSVALIHDQLDIRDNPREVDMRTFLVTLGGELERRALVRARQAPVLRVSGAGLILDVDRAIPLALVINELLTTAFEQAKPGPPLELRVRVDPDEIEIQHAGSGRSPQTEAAGDMLGQRLLGMLLRQLGARAELRHGDDGHIAIRLGR